MDRQASIESFSSISSSSLSFSQVISQFLNRFNTNYSCLLELLRSPPQNPSVLSVLDTSVSELEAKALEGEYFKFVCPLLQNISISKTPPSRAPPAVP